MRDTSYYTSAIVQAITDIDENDHMTPYLYVQSLVIAESGEPVLRLTWNGETQDYDEEIL